MAELLILDFEGVDEADYLNENKELGLDPETGAGDWPAGLISHVAGVSDAGRAKDSRPQHPYALAGAVVSRTMRVGGTTPAGDGVAPSSSRCRRRSTAS